MLTQRAEEFRQSLKAQDQRLIPIANRRRLRANIESQMEVVLYDWEVYRAGKRSNKRQATCCSPAASHSELSELQTQAS